MKKIIYTILFLTLGLSLKSYAQQFINGSLEPSNPGAFTYCSSNLLATFNANMGNITAAGSIANIYVGDSSCSEGIPHAGGHFGGLSYFSSFTQTMIFKLDAAMSAGTSYALEFYYKNGGGFGPCPLKYGYSISATSTDSFVGNIPQTDSMTWQLAHYTLVPKVAAQYIWISSAPPTSGTGDTYVDDFRLRPNAGVNEISVTKGISASPNPFKNTTKITLDDNVALPFDYAIYDIAGRVVVQQTQINKRELVISQGQLGTGMYFIKLTDVNKQMFCSKLVAQ